MSATSWMTGHASERHARSTVSAPNAATTSTLAAEIGLNDPLIALNGSGRPLRDLVAVIENEHGLAEPHDDFHVVLDQQHRLARVSKARDGVQQIVEQRPIDAGRGLIEQDQRRI